MCPWLNSLPAAATDTAWKRKVLIVKLLAETHHASRLEVWPPFGRECGTA
jgi:hypothetical protein